MEETVAIGCVVKLDRGFPLVRLEDGAELRCKHATSLVKGERVRAVIGDRVRVSFAERNDKALIVEVLPRSRELVRKDPTERAVPQVLAANFDRVIVTQPSVEVNMRRLERELVLAHETGAAVSVVLTKADLAESEDEVERVRERVRALVGADVETLVVSEATPESVEAVRALVPEGTTAVLIGRSGVGKSSLVNLLVGRDVQETGTVRETDGAGRHTTVSREMVSIPHGGYVVDMPGVRGLGLWDADAGIGVAFAAVPLFIYQGAITVFAGALSPYLSDFAVAEMSCTGSLLIFALGLNMIGAAKVKVANYLPAIFLPIAICPLYEWLSALL